MSERPDDDALADNDYDFDPENPDEAADLSRAAERRRFERATKLSRADLKRLVHAAQRAVESQLPEDEPDYTATWVYEEAIQLAWRSAIIAAKIGRP